MMGFRIFKSKILLIFTLTVFFELGYLGYSLRKVKGVDLDLRVSNRYVSKDLNYYDPLKNRSMHQMVITEALYSRLLDKDQQGVVIGSIAESFDIKNKREIIFKSRDDLKTFDGNIINNHDVVFSLKRLVTTSNAFSVQFRDLIDDCIIALPTDPCEGIKALQGNRVVIKSKIYPDLLLESLVDSAYSIVPMSSFSADMREINDFQNTSGPYYFHRFTEEGYLVLKANPRHFHFHPRMPQRLIIIGKNNKSEGNKISIYQSFMEDKIDHIPLSETLIKLIRNDQLIEQSEAGGFDFYRTYGLLVRAAKFTLRGRKLPKSERLGLGIQIRKAVREITVSKIVNMTPMYIMEPGFGCLSHHQKASYLSKLEAITPTTTGKNIVLELPDYSHHLLPIFRKYLPDIQIVEPADDKISSTDRVKTDRADIVFTMEFPGISETYSWISWAIGARIFPLSEEEGRKWIKEYAQTASWERRRDLYRDLQYRALIEDPTIVPIGHMPKIAYIKAPWKMSFTPFDVSNPFHRIRYEN